MQLPLNLNPSSSRSNNVSLTPNPSYGPKHTGSFGPSSSQKKRVSRGSALFSEMQLLTNRIKMIDNAQDVMIHEKINKPSREGSATSKKLEDSINTNSILECSVASPFKVGDHKSSTACLACREKQSQLLILHQRTKSLQKQLENEQKQVIYLNFQQELMKDAVSKSNSLGDRNRQLVDTVKLMLRKTLQKFMFEVVVNRLTKIENSMSGLAAKLQNLATIKPSSPESQHIRRNQPKGDRQDANGIRTEGEMEIASSTINLRKRSATKQTQSTSEVFSRIKVFEATIKQKNNAMFEIQRELATLTKKNLETVHEYESQLDKARKVANEKGALQNKGSITVQPSPNIRIKQLQEKLAACEKEYRKLNQRYLSVHRKEVELNTQLQRHRQETATFESQRTKHQLMQKEMILKTKEAEGLVNQLKQEKDVRRADVGVINKLKQQVQELEFELSLKKDQPEQVSGSSETQLKVVNFQKEFKLFQESNNKLKAEIKNLNWLLQGKSKQVDSLHTEYKTQLFEKEKKLHELEMILKEDFSKIRDSRDSDYRVSKGSESSLMLSATRMMSVSKELDFILTEGDVTVSELPNIQEIFNSRDFGKVNLDNYYDQQEFLRKVGDYIDVVKSGRRLSRSKSRTPSEERYKEDKKGTDVRNLVQNILAQIVRINKEIPNIIKDQFFKLKSLLQKFKQQLGQISSNHQLLAQLKDSTLSLVRLMPKDGNKRTEQAVKNIRYLLKASGT